MILFICDRPNNNNLMQESVVELLFWIFYNLAISLNDVSNQPSQFRFFILSVCFMSPIDFISCWLCPSRISWPPSNGLTYTHTGGVMQAVYYVSNYPIIKSNIGEMAASECCLSKAFIRLLLIRRREKFPCRPFESSCHFFRPRGILPVIVVQK